MLVIVHPFMSLTIASVLDELEFAMRMHMLHVLAVAGTLLVVPVAWAHHSFSMFDQTKISRITDAKVAEFRFTNPHSFVVIEQGGIRYVLECNSINMMIQAGWQFNSLKAGDKVDLAYYPLRTGKPGGMLKTITLPNGKMLRAW